MAITYSLYLRTDKKLKDGRCPVYLRITENRKSKYRSTGVKVKPTDWNDNKNEVRRSHPNYETLNQLLQQAVQEAQKAAATITTDANKLDAIISKLKGDNTDFFKMADTMLAEVKKTSSYYTYKNHKVAIQKIKAFHGQATLKLRVIDAAFLERFEKHLRDNYGNAKSTIAKNFRTLKKIIHKAHKDGIIERNPFNRFDGAKDSRKTNKEKLTFNEIKNIQALMLKPGTNIYHSRNAFLFSFYSGGIRFGDICQLKWSHVNENKLTYKMAKNDKNLEIDLNESQKEILALYDNSNGYIFPFLNPHKTYTETSVRQAIGNKNSTVNDCLKEIADKAGIDKNVSFHIARHSFAQYAVQSGLSVFELQQTLRHSKLETTQQYLESLNSQAANKAMKKVF